MNVLSVLLSLTDVDVCVRAFGKCPQTSLEQK